LTREEALDHSLEWLGLLSAAQHRRRAAELLGLMRVFNIAQGYDKDAYVELQRDLIKQARWPTTNDE
jgi:hypothetical protein